jgi:salicylate hydroxylase
MKIAIAGCGPGGLASALFLKRAGHQVTLFDQFDKPRPLGSGLLIQPSGQEVLAQLGLLEQARTVSAPVTRLFGLDVANGKRALDMEYRHLGAGVHALGIHRASLFDLLFDAVRDAGIDVRTGHKLVGANASGDGVTPVFTPAVSDQVFDLLIDASGSHSPLATGENVTLPFAALWCTVDLPGKSDIAQAALDQRYVGAHKMAGIMPVGLNPETGNPGAALFWSIKPADMAALKKAGIKSWRRQFLEVWPQADAFVRQVGSFGELTLAIYCHRTGRPATNNHILHLGDSWHCTSPQLGQGANMALIDAAALASAIGRSESLDDIQRRYRYYRCDHVKLYQALSLIFTPLYQSDSRILPWLRDLIIHHSARLPLVRSLIARVVSGKLGKFD